MSMQPSALEDDGKPMAPVLEIPAEGKTRSRLETIADMEGKILSELAASMLAASKAHTGEEDDDPSPDEDDEIGDEWDKLTDEILRLESIRRKIIQLAAEETQGLSNSTEHLQRLFKANDRKIRSCEEELEKLMARCKKRSPVCGISADDCHH